MSEEVRAGGSAPGAKPRRRERCLLTSDPSTAGTKEAKAELGSAEKRHRIVLLLFYFSSSEKRAGDTVCFQPALFLCLCPNTIGVSSSKPDLNIKAKIKRKPSKLPAEEPAPLKMSLKWHQTAVRPSLERRRRHRRRERQLINGTQLRLR